MLPRNPSIQIYAPQPQGPGQIAAHLYPPPNEPGLGPVSSFRSSPSPSENTQIDLKTDTDTTVNYRAVTRTPSPTPSESDALKNKAGSFDVAAFKRQFTLEYLKNPKNVVSLIVTLVVLGLLIAFIVEQDNIIKALRPAANWMHRTPGGWLIPIGIMIILSFPPLFGHELVALLVGDVWGIGIGFGIVAAGTIIGELVTYYTFRYCCKSRGEKIEAKNLQYALYSEVIREGGFKVAVIVRFSTIPAHLTTAVFATCGMGVLTFLAAAFLALPKQLATVYLGSGEVSSDGSQKENKTQKIVKVVVIIVTIIMTIVAMRYVNGRIDLIKQRVIYKRRKVRQTKLSGGSSAAPSESSSDWQGAIGGSPAQADVDVEDPMTPLVPSRRDRDGSMDVAEVTAVHPQRPTTHKRSGPPFPVVRDPVLPRYDPPPGLRPFVAGGYHGGS